MRGQVGLRQYLCPPWRPGWKFVPARRTIEATTEAPPQPIIQEVTPFENSGHGRLDQKDMNVLVGIGLSSGSSSLKATGGSQRPLELGRRPADQWVITPTASHSCTAQRVGMWVHANDDSGRERSDTVERRRFIMLFEGMKDQPACSG